MQGKGFPLWIFQRDEPGYRIFPLVISGLSPLSPLLLAKASLASDLGLKFTSREKSQIYPTGLITKGKGGLVQEMLLDFPDRDVASRPLLWSAWS